MGTLAASKLGRAWLVVLAVLLVGLANHKAASRRRCLPSSSSRSTSRQCPAAYGAPGARRLKTRTKVLLGFLIYLAIIVAVGVIFGSYGKNNEFQPQNEFKLDPWITIKIAGIDLSINKAVLYLVLASALTIFTMVWIARRMQTEAEPGPDRDRGRLRPDQEQHHRHQPRHGGWR